MDNSKKILKQLENEYSGGPFLNAKNPFEVLVSTILSAQCTDKRVNKVTKVLFKEYKTPKDFANVSQNELEKYIYSTGFYRSKAKSIISSAKTILTEYDGKVPNEMNELLRLRGVARKTANIVLSSGFNKHEGIAVDTHVKRVSHRIGLTEHKNPVKIEQDLMKIYPKSKWQEVSWLLIEHGRAFCKAPTPTCSNCFFENTCPKKGVSKFK